MVNDKQLPATILIETILEASGWDAVIPNPAALVEIAARAALGTAYTGPAAEVSVVLADDAAVQILNRDYRGQDKPTNVLSFPLGDDPAEAVAQGRAVMLGDVILALETVMREARDQGKTINDHLTHLIVHGILHILGYDHMVEVDALAMEALESNILAGLGVGNPYADSCSDARTGDE